MGVFGKIKDAKFSDGGVYILEGTGRVEIQAIKYLEKLQQKPGAAFIVDVKYVESDNLERKPGCLAAWFVSLVNAPAMGNIRQFVETLLPESKDLFNQVGRTPAEEAEIEAKCDQLIMALCAEANPMKGRLLRFSATNIKTKGKGTNFTKVKWLPDEMTAAQVAAEAAKG